MMLENCGLFQKKCWESRKGSKSYGNARAPGRLERLQLTGLSEVKMTDSYRLLFYSSGKKALMSFKFFMMKLHIFNEIIFFFSGFEIRK